jgi:hypothetical protein
MEPWAREARKKEMPKLLQTTKDFVFADMPQRIRRELILKLVSRIMPGWQPRLVNS